MVGGVSAALVPVDTGAAALGEAVAVVVGVPVADGGEAGAMLLGGGLAAVSFSLDLGEPSGALVGLHDLLVVNADVVEAANGGAEGSAVVGAVGSAAVE